MQKNTCEPQHATFGPPQQIINRAATAKQAAASASALKSEHSSSALFSSHHQKQPLPRIDDQTHRIARRYSVRHRYAAQHAATKGKKGKKRCRCTRKRPSRRARGGDARDVAARALGYCIGAGSTILFAPIVYTLATHKSPPTVYRCRPSRCRSAATRARRPTTSRRATPFQHTSRASCWRSSARSLVLCVPCSKVLTSDEF